MKIRNTCVTGAIILNGKNEILLQRRGDDNNWCIPGGGMEIGETVEDAIIREVYEETGLKINNIELFNVYSGKNQYHRYPDGNEYYFVNVVFKINKIDGELKIDDNETKELKYFELHKLPSNISLTNIPILKDLKAKWENLKQNPTASNTPIT
ncbi:NUDIX hydrolase [Fusibacter ferrireducens]|uniref:NUDIX hydrolase n=1 Tax=Fusibacter ferrireducens TaxID=2785058 RepID=A0ABR9ZLY4_9FIRM|nr:NUDIX hydrolase [Fusibacter ferrireducens]MBF4691483.1 NUDIX hydrolase [Fusibacter ferrireducens]